MYRISKEKYPRIPRDFQEYKILASENPPREIFRNVQAIIDAGENGGAVIFFREEIRDYISATEKVGYDGTFYVVPSNFYQLFTIFIINEDRSFTPSIFLLMTAKARTLYYECFAKVSELIPAFQPTFAISDFEKASRLAFKDVWVEARQVGCYFHFSNSVYRNIQKKGLLNLYKQNKHFKKWAKALMAVPLLRADDIVPTVEELLAQNLDVPADQMPLIESFKRYYRRQWLNNETPQDLSVYEENIKTNNGSESNHAQFKRIIKSHRPNLWAFHVALNNIMADSSIDLERVANGTPVASRPKPSFVRNEQCRANAKIRLEAGEYNPMAYLYCVSHGFDGHLQRLGDRMVDGDSDASEDEQPGADEENGRGEDRAGELRCEVCYGPRDPPMLLMPCNHIACCEACAQIVMSRPRPQCPMCRERIASSVRVYI